MINTIDKIASLELLQVNISVSSFQMNSTCERILRNQLYNELSQRELCAIVNAGSDIACVGDTSGSPVVCRDVLAGIMSYRTNCFADSVYKFTDVARALKWLHNARMDDPNYELFRNASEMYWFLANTNGPSTMKRISITPTTSTLSTTTNATTRTTATRRLTATSQNRALTTFKFVSKTSAAAASTIGRKVSPATARGQHTNELLLSTHIGLPETLHKTTYVILCIAAAAVITIIILVLILFAKFCKKRNTNRNYDPLVNMDIPLENIN